MRESNFQGKLIKQIRQMFPEAIVLKNDPNYIQGIPDLLILNGNKWAALECKRSSNEKHQPNQDHYISKMDQMSYAAFISPDNKEEILHELQQAL